MPVWRLFTAPLFHAGLLHVAMNLSAWVPLGSSLERLVGSVQFAWLTLLFAVLGGLLHALAGTTAEGSGVRSSCTVGLSGVIFSLVVVDAHLTPVASRTLFGVVSVPTRWYPLALLALLQLLLPDASMLGHLAGVLVGYAFIWGYLNWAVLSGTTVNTLERARCLNTAVARQNFILVTGLPDAHGGGLPRWITAPGGTEGVAWRTPGWLARAMAQVSAAAGMPMGSTGMGGAGTGSSAAAGSAFAGRGRTLGGQAGGASAGEGGAVVDIPLQPMQPAPAAAAAAAPPLASSAAEARIRAARAAEARMMSSGSSAAAGSQPAAASAVASAAVGLLPTGSVRAEGMPPGLSQLVAMGFSEANARAALLATNGDISAALDRLSS